MAGKEENSENFESIVMPPVNGGVNTVEITFHRKYEVEPISLDQTQKEEAIGQEPRPFDIDTLLTCFLVKKAGSASIEYNFNPPLEITIIYPEGAWKKAIKDNYNHPRLAYLGRKGDSWVNGWTEFIKEITAIIPPDMCGDSEGKIYLTVNELPDPLIGGC